MLHKSMRKQEIEEELQGKGDFVQIDYLNRFLQQEPPTDIKRFAYQKLADIYEKKSMFTEAAKMYENIAIKSIAFTEKIKFYVKETESFIKAGQFDRADEAKRKALNQANSAQKAEIVFAIKDFYKRQGEAYVRQLKRSQAIRIYEKLMEMNLSDSEKEEIKDKLLNLYEKLGRFKESQRLRALS